MAMNVDGKTAIITGAGSGINFSYAQLLLSKGCNVVIADLCLRPESEDLVAQYPLSGIGAKAVFVKTDVADWTQLDNMFEVAIRHFGGAHIVCPGAGIYEPPWTNFWSPPGSAESTDKLSASRYAMVDINITHPIRVTQLAIQHFLSQRRSGTVVHVSSTAGQVPFFPTPVYVASKHAINGLVRSLGRLEKPPAHIPKIRVNCVAPARVLTPLWTDHPEKMKTVGKAGNWTSVEAVAQVMLDLVQKEEYVGGSIVEVGANVRIVAAFDDAGPQGHGNALTSQPGYDTDMWESLEGMMGGSEKTNGTNGAHDSNGTHGTNGTNGTHGTNGNHSTNGANGINGTNGTHSTNGTHGSNGTNGV